MPRLIHLQPLAAVVKKMEGRAGIIFVPNGVECNDGTYTEGGFGADHKL